MAVNSKDVIGKRYTWEEIKRMFPNQWVGLIDIEWEDEINVKSAVIKYTDKSRDEIMIANLDGEKGLYGFYTTPNDSDDFGGLAG